MKHMYNNEIPQSFSPSQSLWFNEMDTSPPTPSTNLEQQQQAFHGHAGQTFDQPFVPQDLWQMPMTFEWDWADVTGQLPWDGQSAL